MEVAVFSVRPPRGCITKISCTPFLGDVNTVTWPSLVVSWQLIYVSLSLQTTHEDFFSPLNSFLAFILHLPTQFNSSAPRLMSWQAGVSKLDPILCSTLHSAEHFFITTFTDSAKNTTSVLLGRHVYSAVPWQRKLLDCCLRIHCRGNVFTESLPSNERLFWLCYSGFGRHVTLSINARLKKLMLYRVVHSSILNLLFLFWSLMRLPCCLHICVLCNGATQRLSPHFSL
jgi:hypothetical protein